MDTAWLSPVPHRLIVTNRSNSFLEMPYNATGLPVGNHVGAFGYRRQYHIHEGVDLYVPEGTPVNTVSPGTIVAIEPFTGPQLGQLWWRDTMAIFVEHDCGVVVYGEIEPLSTLKVGDPVGAGQLIGYVVEVLVKKKGRPTSMLHLELHQSGSRDVVEWYTEKPAVLRDPTPFLRHTANLYSINI